MVFYNTIRDYKRLRVLLDAGYEVVCFTTYDFGRPRASRMSSCELSSHSLGAATRKSMEARDGR